MRQFVLVLLALLAGSVWLTAATAAPGDGSGTNGSGNPPPARTTAGTRTAQQVAAIRYLGQEVRQYEHVTWHWQNLMGTPLAPTGKASVREMSIADAKQALARWQRLAAGAQRQGRHPPDLAAWLCIHSREGSWTDAAPPYFGGLQMDLGFQRTYGGDLLRAKGTADHWTPLEQIWVAEKARRSGRGFTPWPNTARACGLL